MINIKQMRKRDLYREISKTRIFIYIFVNIVATRKFIFVFKQINDIVYVELLSFVLNSNKIL